MWRIARVVPERSNHTGGIRPAARKRTVIFLKDFRGALWEVAVHLSSGSRTDLPSATDPASLRTFRGSEESRPGRSEGRPPIIELNLDRVFLLRILAY